MWEWLQELDAAFFIHINHGHTNPIFDFLMPIVSDFRYFLGPFVLVWLFFFLKRGKKARWLAIAFLILIGFTDNLSSKVIKPIVNRPRPHHTLDGVHYYRNQWQSIAKALTRQGSSKSFPSSHATNVFAGAAFLIRLLPKGWALILPCALLVGYSRIYLGVHYPLDVLAGAMIGICCGLGAFKLFEVLWEKREGLPVVFKKKRQDTG